MIIILKPYIHGETREFQRLEAHLKNLPNIEMRVHHVQGAEQVLTEIYLIGNTAALSLEEMKSFPGVDHVVRVSEEYRVLGRHKDDHRPNNFSYQGVSFSQDNLNIFAGLCAVDSPKSVEAMMSLAGKRTGLHTNGRIQTAHKSLFFSRLRQKLLAIRF